MKRGCAPGGGRGWAGGGGGGETGGWPRRGAEGRGARRTCGRRARPWSWATRGRQWPTRACAPAVAALVTCGGCQSSTGEAAAAVRVVSTTGMIPPAGGMNVKIFAGHDNGGCGFYRMLLPMRQLAAHGFDVTYAVASVDSGKDPVTLND